MKKTQTYQLRDIPLSLWAEVRAKAIIEGVTVKYVILRLLQEYTDTRNITKMVSL